MALFPDRKTSVDTTEDENRDGRIDWRDDVPAQRVAEDDATDVSDRDRSDRVANDVARDRVKDRQEAVGRAQVDEREAARGRLTPAAAVGTDTAPEDRDTAAEGTIVDTRASTEPVPDRTEVVAGPRPRASLLATLSLVLGVTAALTVLTGLLAGPGVALGIIAAVLAIGGITATSRRHVAGKSDALLGMALGLAAVVFGSLALTGTLSWLTPETDQVNQARDWLQAQLPWLFPS